MANERGYRLNVAGFVAALQWQRKQSHNDLKSRKLPVVADELRDLDLWQTGPDHPAVGGFFGYDRIAVESLVTAVKTLEGGQLAVMLRESPFYAAPGGQVSDVGEIVGNEWSLDVRWVHKIDGRVAAIGTVTDSPKFEIVKARVPADHLGREEGSQEEA